MGDVTIVHRVSVGLFGNKYKLDVLAAIHEVVDSKGPDIYARQISQLVPAAADNQVAVVLRQLAHAGFLQSIEDKSDPLRHYYRVQQSSIWEAASTLRTELATAAWTTAVHDS